jgi:ketosteroid isomerase-like protein
LPPVATPNAAIVLSAFDAFNSGDWELATRNLDPDFEWVNDEETSRMTGTELEARGPERVREFWRSFSSFWEEWRMQPGEPVESASNRVLVPVKSTGRGKGSGVPIEFDFFQVWTIRDGAPMRIENHRDRSAAMSAAGLDPQSLQE